MTGLPHWKLKSESASSDMIGKCVGGITSVVVVPTFPSLSDIFARAGDRICHVASDRLRDATTLPPLTVPGMPGLPGTAIPVLPFAAPIAPPAPANFWERIWR
ncbi:hypothetical protein LP419_37500 [Massilia sp. H-1]|nr:hypothetical protein LP419_37500 [Massilia sp. H-1]